MDSRHRSTRGWYRCVHAYVYIVVTRREMNIQIEQWIERQGAREREREYFRSVSLFSIHIPTHLHPHAYTHTHTHTQAHDFFFQGSPGDGCVCVLSALGRVCFPEPDEYSLKNRVSETASCGTTNRKCTQLAKENKLKKTTWKGSLIWKANKNTHTRALGSTEEAYRNT